MPVILRLLLAGLLIAGFTGSGEAACTTAAQSLTFTPGSSYDVRAGSIQNASGNAGLSCTGSLLSVLGSGYARATVTSANAFKLDNGTGDQISYQVSADPNATYAFTQGGTIDYMNATLVSLLGLFSNNSFTAPLYAQLTGTPNVSAGTYTDTLTIQWNYYICNGVQIGAACLFYETGTKTVTATVTLVVGQDCRISAPNVSFGSVALTSQFQPISQAVLVDCTKNSSYKVAFSTGASGVARPWRTMTDGAGHSLQYNLYRADGVTIWDETNPMTSATAGTGAITPAQVQSYVAKVNTSQTTPPAGAYSDTVNVVITF
jgi:spore coat protein U-like protein